MVTDLVYFKWFTFGHLKFLNINMFCYLAYKTFPIESKMYHFVQYYCISFLQIEKKRQYWSTIAHYCVKVTGLWGGNYIICHCLGVFRFLPHQWSMLLRLVIL
jgi:hypothetical protein